MVVLEIYTLPCTEVGPFFLGTPSFSNDRYNFGFLFYADEDGNTDDDCGAEDDDDDNTFNAISICNPFILASC